MAVWTACGVISYIQTIESLPFTQDSPYVDTS